MNTALADSNMFPKPLRELVTQKFIRARANKDITFSDTQLTVLHNSYKVPIQLRFCPALAHKPAKDNHAEAKEKTPKKPFDPFEDPLPELLVAHMPLNHASHNLVLNKYPVIPNHFILATKDNKPQTGLLEENDLSLSHECLRAWEENGHSLFAFFNSGEHSGASQPHRHLQFLPIEDMVGDDRDGWSPLCETMTSAAHILPPLLSNTRLPFVHFAMSLEDDPSAAELFHRYITLLKAGLAGIGGQISPESLHRAKIEDQGRTTFSYNLAMTRKLMAILPRRSESAKIPDVPEGSVAINGTILAGTMMVKSEQEWTRLREKPELVQQLLREITFLPPKEPAADRQNL